MPAPMADEADTRPLIVGLGGTIRANSSTERVLRFSLERMEAQGFDTRLFAGADLDAPPYAGPGRRSGSMQSFLDTVRRAQGLIVATPAYHGSISGMIKNALDYTEDLRDDPRVYLDGMPVGCIVCAGGWQAAALTLSTLRNIVHALRGWPTPSGVIVNTSTHVFDDGGRLADGSVRQQIEHMSDQIGRFLKPSMEAALHERALTVA